MRLLAEHLPTAVDKAGTNGTLQSSYSTYVVACLAGNIGAASARIGGTLWPDAGSAIVSEQLAASWRENGHGLSVAPGGRFALLGVGLVLWVAPGLLVVRSDLLTMAEDLAANPLQHLTTIAMVLGLALVYVVLTGWSTAAGALHLTEGRSRYLKICVMSIIAPLVLLSLALTAMSSFAFFLSVAILCFPALL